MGKVDQQLQQARERAEQARTLAEKRRKEAILKKSIQYAGQGQQAFESEHYADAITAFHNYLHLLERVRNVRRHGLSPDQFDKQTDVRELLLVAGVYWDLAKIYDRSRKQIMIQEMRIYLAKYVLFAKGMPYSNLCAESLRKYIDNDKPLHRGDFKSAYTALTGQKKCYVVTALGDVTQPATLRRLRAFRAGYLRQRFWGRWFIRGYYRSGPVLARATERLPDSCRAHLGRALDRLARALA